MIALAPNCGVFIIANGSLRRMKALAGRLDGRLAGQRICRPHRRKCGQGERDGETNAGDVCTSVRRLAAIRRMVPSVTAFIFRAPEAVHGGWNRQLARAPSPAALPRGDLSRRAGEVDGGVRPMFHVQAQSFDHSAAGTAVRTGDAAGRCSSPRAAMTLMRSAMRQAKA